jgi:DNA ligase 1
MNRFAELLDRLSFEPSRNDKLRLIVDYFRSTPDPERGYALAAMTDSLAFRNAKPGLIRALVSERVDPVLFAMSYDYVGDLSETAALIWPSPAREPSEDPPPGASLSEIVETLGSSSKLDLPGRLARWLDALDETGRWALLKLITGSLRVGVSARLAKTALADMAGLSANEIEEVWHGLKPPYLDLFAWVEGRGKRPEPAAAAPFRAPMLAQPLEESDFALLQPADYAAEWKWDGVRVQAAAGPAREGNHAAQLYSRAGEDISAAFPDLLEVLDNPLFAGATIDGELLIVRDGRVQPFSVLQQRLNRKTVSLKLLADYPAHIRAYDLLTLEGEDKRPLPLRERRALLELFVGRLNEPRIDLSSLIEFADWPSLAAARSDPRAAGAGADSEAVEGIMLKRLDSPYLPGRPRGHWWKWKRDPFNVDAVLMYAQRGHGKRSSFYSDYTFGVWRNGASGDELVPVGKAYFGFTDEELGKLDRWVRNHTRNRFGPVREVVAEPGEGLVLEVAFEGLNRSARHRSGLAMRFPRIARIRWEKPPREADRIEFLQALLKREPAQSGSSSTGQHDNQSGRNGKSDGAD